jgi:hypothetical protein
MSFESILIKDDKELYIVLNDFIITTFSKITSQRLFKQIHINFT